MRVIQRIGPMPAKNTQPNGARVDGTATFEMVLYDKGEPIPQGLTGIPVSEFRTKLIPGDLRMPAGRLDIPDIVVPAAEWATWPDDARVVVHASWVIKKS